MRYPLTVADFLARAEGVYPDRIAVVDEPDQPAGGLGSFTYWEMAGMARAQAAQLDHLEVPAGGRVAIVSQNSARLLTSFYGVSGYGRVLVPVNYRLAEPEIEYIVSHCGAQVVYVDPTLKKVLDRLDVAHKFVLGEDDALYRHGAEPRPAVDVEEDATATINYTSGTTARPKGVELTHRNLWLNAVVLGLHTQISDRDVYLHTLPMFHVNGWGMPYGLTGVGAQHIVMRQIDGFEILRRVAEHGVTLMCAAPAVLHSVLDAAGSWIGPIPGHGRVRVLVGGAPPPTRTIERVMDELGWEFIQVYGQTETSPIVVMNRARREWDGLSTAAKAKRLVRAGVPSLGVQLDLDEEGEILVAANQNFAGYWEQPEATARSQEGNWLHTGNGGYFDDDGYLVIADRKKDMIISGGENVASIEVEDALMSHPAVREVAVIGIPDETWGELVTAIVVLEDPAVGSAELIAHCRTLLAGYKCPKRIDVVPELARTSTGKVQKFKLREQYWAGYARQVN